MAEMNLDFWRAIRRLSAELAKDPTLAAQFDAEPLKVLTERGLDLPVRTDAQGQSHQSLADVLASMNSDEREATLRSVRTLGTHTVADDAVVLAIANVFAIANANLDANANAVANANANANADANVDANVNTNCNTSGEDACSMSAAVLPVPLALPSDFEASELSKQLTAAGLSPVRQKALMRQALTDPRSGVASELGEHGQRRVVRYSYRGITFEAEGFITDTGIRLVRTDVVK